MYRRRLFKWYAVGLLVLAVVAYAGIPRLRSYLESLTFYPMLVRVEVLAIAILAISIPAAFYLLRLGSKTIRQERYPCEGMKVIRDTKIVEGPAARRMGIAFRTLGIISLVFSIGGIIATHIIFEAIRHYYRLNFGG